MRRLACLVFLFMALPALALELTLPATITLKPGRLSKISVHTDSKLPVKWFVSSEDADLIPSESGKYAIFSSTVPGVYRVVAYTSDEKGPSEPAICQVVVAGPAPVPPGPLPPGPGPTPPTPTPAPIPGPGFKCLILYDVAASPKLPPAQLSVLYSTPLRDYMSSQASSTAGWKNWRVWDASVTPDESEPQIFRDALKRPHPILPWIVVSNATTGWEGPLPATVADTMTLLKKYAEAP